MAQNACTHMSQILGMTELLSEILFQAHRQYRPTHHDTDTGGLYTAFHPILVSKLWWDVGSDHLWSTECSTKLLKTLAPIRWDPTVASLVLDMSVGLRGCSLDRFMFYASKIRELHLRQSCSANITMELESCLPPNCFPRLRTLGLGTQSSVWQLLPYLKLSKPLAKMVLELYQNDPSLSDLPDAITTTSHISLHSLAINITDWQPLRQPSIDVCVNIIRNKTSLDHLSLKFQTPEDVLLLCQQMDELQTASSCDLTCQEFSVSSALQELTATLPLKLSYQNLRTLHLKVPNTPPIDGSLCISFDELFLPLFSFHELQELHFSAMYVLIPISREQISSMATAWPKMRSLDLTTGLDPMEGKVAMSLASLPYFREFGDTLEELTVSVTFDELSSLETGYRPMTGLRQLDLGCYALDLTPHNMVVEIIDAVCTEETQIKINGYEFETIEERAWQSVKEELKSIRHARGKRTPPVAQLLTE